jgi:hypothetical protein
MTTEIRAPIVIRGWVVLRDLHVDRVEVDRTDWEWGPLPYVSEYGEDKDVLVFHEIGADRMTDRVEADVNITEPIHQLIDAADISAHRWVAGKAELDDDSLRRMVDPLATARTAARLLDEQMQADPAVIAQLLSALSELNRMIRQLRGEAAE